MRSRRVAAELEDSLSIGVDRMQRNFEPMRRQVGSWRAQQLSTPQDPAPIHAPVGHWDRVRSRPPRLLFPIDN